MLRLSWRELLQPAYVFAFLDGFLMGFIPLGTMTHVALNGSAHTALRALPDERAILPALLVGVWSGLRSVRSLASPPPNPPAILSR